MQFEPGYAYRMPVAFGPLPGPRQTLPGSGPGGGTGSGPGDGTQGAEATITSYTLRLTSTAEALSALLPPCFDLAGEPVLIVEYTELTDVPWLAGRGYDTFAIKIPARFEGREDRVTGSFVAVVWENMADPIITGREELGYAKLFADLACTPLGPDGHRCEASWDGHTFAELELSGLVEGAPEPTPEPVPNPTAHLTAQDDGVLNYRYIPSVDAGSQPDCAGPVLTPAVGGVKILRQATGTGSVRFVKSSWEQLPTFYPIVNTLERLPLAAHGDCVVRRLRRDIQNRGQRRLV